MQHPRQKPGAHGSSSASLAGDASELKPASCKLQGIPEAEVLAYGEVLPEDLSKVRSVLWDLARQVPLLDELLGALAAPTPEQDQTLIKLGVSADIMWFVGAAKIRPSDSLHELDPDGEPAWVIPCIDGGNTVDLLAFKRDEPGRWWLRLGVCAFLGGDALGDVVMDEPVRAFKTPLSWLRAGAPADGLVVLNWDTVRRELIYHNLIAEDIEHGVELERRLSIPAQRPQIRVPKAKAA